MLHSLNHFYIFEYLTHFNPFLTTLEPSFYNLWIHKFRFYTYSFSNTLLYYKEYQNMLNIYSCHARQKFFVLYIRVDSVLTSKFFLQNRKTAPRWFSIATLHSKDWTIISSMNTRENGILVQPIRNQWQWLWLLQLTPCSKEKEDGRLKTAWLR